jgi:hypothetical protein
MRWEPKKLNDMHKQILAFIVAKPEATYKEIAAEFKVTPVFIGMLVRSDLFQSELNAQTDLIIAEAAAGVRDRLESIAHTSLARLEKKIEVSVDFDELFRTAEMTTKALGFSQKTIVEKAAPAPQILVLQEVLESAREKVYRMGRVPGTTRVLEGESQEIRGEEDRIEVREKSEGVFAERMGRLSVVRAVDQVLVSEK